MIHTSNFIKVVGVFLLVQGAGCGKDKDPAADKATAVEKDDSKATAAKTPEPTEPAKTATPPEPEPKPEPEPLGECPTATAISELRTSIDISESGPYDWKSFTIAKAKRSDDGKKIQIFISNQDYPLKKMGGLMTPVKEKGDAILVFNLYGGDKNATIGEFQPGKYKDPNTVLSEVQISKGEKGAMVGLGIREGVVRIIDLPDGKICGDFEVNSKNKKSFASGSFIATFE